MRARETAQVLAAGLKPKPAIAEVEALAPGGRPQAIVEAIKTHAKRYRRLALVGHEPDLGELAARLLGARGNDRVQEGRRLPDRRRRRHAQADRARCAGCCRRRRSSALAP